MSKTLRKWVGSALSVLLMLIANVASSAPLSIEWQIVKRFPLIGDSFEKIESRWLSKSTMPNQNMRHLILNLMNDPIDDRFILANPQGARKFEAENDLSRKEKVDIQVKVSAAGPTCQWFSEGRHIATDSNNECVATLAAYVDEPQTIRVQFAGESAEVIVLPRRLLIAALGDSFASGEGSPDAPTSYTDATPRSNEWFLKADSKESVKLRNEPLVLSVAKWWDSECHRSLLSWPVLAALKVALTSPHFIVHLVDYACSGAEFFDGVFLAQRTAEGFSPIKGPDRQRDGAGPRYVEGLIHGEGFKRRSQINALRDTLCGPEIRDRVKYLDLPRRRFETAIRECDYPIATPDALLLSMGGNDIGFSSAVLGMFTPDTPKSQFFPFMWASQIGLRAIRNVTGAITVEELRDNAQALTPYYPQYLTAMIEGALTDAGKSVLIAYPNPVGPEGVKSDALKCNSFAIQKRVKYSFITFGVTARYLSPWFVSPRIRWAVNLSSSEVRDFTDKAFPAIQAMQRSAASTGVKIVDFLADDPDAFKHRLLCTDEPPDSKTLSDEIKKITPFKAQRNAAPYFFCQEGRGGDGCFDGEGANIDGAKYANRSMQDWKAHRPGRRIVNSTNDALLVQRSWRFNTGNEPATFKEHLLTTLSGAMHPVTEAHGLAADSAFERLCEALQTAPSRCSPASCRTYREQRAAVCSGARHRTTQ